MATNSARPSIHFSRDEDTHSRDQSAQSVTDIPLTKVTTTESTKSRRSVFSAIADRFRSGSRSSSNSRSRSRPHSKDAHRNSLDIDRVTSIDGDTRHSSTEVEGRDRKRSSGGDYADVIRAQALFMEKLREERARDNITHNIDGLPIPPPQERERRRSSIVHALGFDKPLLAR
ncbi:hypothetical protein BGZ80_011441 [Entomortierella chlamydospora]|uniref:Uncharacterized protein n=1 Tax=Entomortierella chlamydospora TaxID=101097 RepID=A0A9P6N3W7_9FUNG|nr:hypothetical protein BGZ79_004180 [Entomortierella chlamydospora]KAG0022706.1 hypothetical protein BGZ80_011441 [Entomortierella chlamydospora]